MSIQYAGGTLVNATTTQTLGTRAELAGWIKDQLVSAGWTVSVTATNDWKLDSATTPQGLQCRVRVYDSGTGNCARLKFSNVSGTKTQVGDLFLLPAVGKQWRVVSNRYQFFVMSPGSTTAREFACGGTPYLVAGTTGLTECLWCVGHATGDTDTSPQNSFRNKLHCRYTGPQAPSQFAVANGNIYETSSAAQNIGLMRLGSHTGGYNDESASLYRLHDDSQLILDPLIGWGLTGITDEAKIRGQLWDAAILTDAWTGDSIETIDPANPTYQFIAVTNNNTGSTTESRGTLFVRVS